MQDKFPVWEINLFFASINMNMTRSGSFVSDIGAHLRAKHQQHRQHQQQANSVLRDTFIVKKASSPG
jgi:hypothetical protein